MNDFYSASGTPSTGSQGASAPVRGEFNALQAAFDKMPGLSGNGLKAVRVNSGASGLEAVAVTGTGSAVFSISPTLVTPILGVAVATSLALSGQLTSTLVTGTAPFVVASATLVANLYAARAALADTVTTNANLTGPITSSGNTTSVASQTGVGSKFVMDSSPTLITPNIGAATATSINGVGIAGTSGKTLTVSNSLTVSGTDGSTLNIGTGGTLGTAAYTASSAYATVAQATSALAATGGSMDGVTIGASNPAAATLSRLNQQTTSYTPGANAGVAIDWSKGSSSITTNGTNAITFTAVPAGANLMCDHFVMLDTFNNVTWPLSVNWGVSGRPSIAGAAWVSLVTRNAGTSFGASIFWRAA